MRLWSRARRAAPSNPLSQVVADLGSGTRQAILAAAAEGPLRRRTWDGCPFNRAGAQLGQTVCTREDVVRVFGLSSATVDRFLRIWDSFSFRDDASCTALLIAAIEQLEGPVASEFIIGSTEAATSIGDRELGPTSGMEAPSDEELREVLGSGPSV